MIWYVTNTTYQVLNLRSIIPSLQARCIIEVCFQNLSYQTSETQKKEISLIAFSYWKPLLQLYGLEKGFRFIEELKDSFDAMSVVLRDILWVQLHRRDPKDVQRCWELLDWFNLEKLKERTLFHRHRCPDFFKSMHGILISTSLRANRPYFALSGVVYLVDVANVFKHIIQSTQIRKLALPASWFNI